MALAQLRAVEAVAPLLAALDALDQTDDDWWLEEWPFVFGRIGPGALDLLESYVLDPAHRVYPRNCAVMGIRECARFYPQQRESVVERLRRVLERAPELPPEVNGELIYCLVQLEAREAAETVERAFAAGRVDLTLAGGWDLIREELGVEGLGLVTADSPKNPDSFAEFRERWSALPPVRTFAEALADERKTQKKKRKRRRRR